ncbi:hypothetical protein DL239_18000 [Sedimentitalea sp. CY04]|uniref:N-acetyltransferase domain-containing protein n=1 Tax=Parasedimentitalea denitrificans TaxID=2211118 RepID=A0ABX0WEZ0_9RHOB|nr:GNAT family N-acetyltransferase [Sedimentitalea sp. CY04]NIZ62866.1 hypothetical protein [Sedimentitalea sp. CY04]
MVDINHAHPSEREEIAQFMAKVFPRAKWSMDGWRAILDGRWGRANDSYAITVRDQGKLVGALGLVTAQRPTANGPRITANMTSWYLLKPYRGTGVGRKMIELATANPDITVTDFTSSPGAVHAVKRAGLVELDTQRLIWKPSTSPAQKLPIHPNPLELGNRISTKDKQILQDHLNLPLTPLAIETPNGPLVVVLSIKQKHDDYVTHEVMYLGNRDLFALHARAIADSLLPSSSAILSVDGRLLPASVEPDVIEEFAIPRFYTPGRMAPEDIDHLYTEVVLLGLKLY